MDIGIFSEKDPRIAIIKEAVRIQCERFLDQGTEWFVFTGNLGFEYWTLQVLQELRKAGYDFQMATLFCFEDQGKNWNEANQEKLTQFHQLDFVKSSFASYEHPNQFREHNRFLLEHTDGAYLFYDPEQETSLKYLYGLISEKENYSRTVLDFDFLNEVAENFSKNEWFSLLF